MWRLATGDSFKNCGLQFGIGMSSAKTICLEFELCLFRLKAQFIEFPLTRQELQELMDEFEEEYGIPQIVGAIDGCHIEINNCQWCRNPPSYYRRQRLSTAEVACQTVSK